MIAHIRKADYAKQTTQEHSVSVARLTSQYASSLNLSALGYLLGLLHDLGKNCRRFSEYIVWQSTHPDAQKSKSASPHALFGAVFAYERWYRRGSPVQKTTAQILAMTIYGHHAGFCDCMTQDGKFPILEKLCGQKDEPHYSECVETFTHEIAEHKKLDAWFDKACAEVEQIRQRVDGFTAIPLGLLSRFLLSCLVDADRWDSACFEYDRTPEDPDELPDWQELAGRLERHLSEFSADTPVNLLRKQVADVCFQKAALPPGVYTLTVPTGGGKTLSSLRYALNHAQKFSKSRIFYIIPFNTILDQNAREIREKLDGYDGILEHHSNVMIEDDHEYADHRILTERWNLGIVLTSMVQLLNAFYQKENTNTRRMHRLANAILIFDEIQALPKQCTALFQKAIQFLSVYCGCTVILCSATQPKLQFGNLPVAELMDAPEWLFTQLRRTRFLDETRVQMTNAQAASRVTELLREHGQVLMVVNTTKVAQNIYERVLAQGFLCVHLSTHLCAAHRLEWLSRIRAMLDTGQPFFCISTSLIEAGIDISFPCAVRSLASLSSIIQTAGRCARNGKLPGDRLGPVYIWQLAEENLSYLPEIERGQQCTMGFLAGGAALDEYETIRKYFEVERKAFADQYAFPVTVNGVKTSVKALLEQQPKLPCENLMLFGAYRTAGEAFYVIPQQTTTVLTPYGEGEALIAALHSKQTMEQRIHTLRVAQRYFVNVYPKQLEILQREGAVTPIADTGIFSLSPAFYDMELGLQSKGGMLPLLEY